MGTESSSSQFCGNCDRYVFQNIYKHRVGAENEDEDDFVAVEPTAEYTVLVENTAFWSPFKGLIISREDKIRTNDDGNLKNAPLVVGIVHVS